MSKKSTRDYKPEYRDATARSILWARMMNETRRRYLETISAGA